MIAHCLLSAVTLGSVNPWTPLLFATLGWGASAVLTRAVILRGVDSYTLVPIRMAFAMVSQDPPGRSVLPTLSVNSVSPVKT